ncbi:MAG: hypothetical protein QOI52_166, partial [Chloroflexota bacterium]|nr:hypothetical protein [Chloroflexota bacterium]
MDVRLGSEGIAGAIAAAGVDE